MKIIRFLFRVLVLIVITAGCSTLGRYRCQKKPGENDNLVNIGAFGFRLSDQKKSDGSKTIWDLNADAQSQLLKILNTRYSGNEDFLNSINFKYLKEDQPAADKDYTSKDLKMVLSVSKSRLPVADIPNENKRLFSVADRIEYLRIKLTLSSPYLIFTGWNLFTTEYGTVDIASVTNTREFELTTNPTATIQTGSEKADSKTTESSTTGKANFSRKEEQALKYRYLKLNGQLNDSMIVLEEEGTREIDLAGNIIADISMKFRAQPCMLSRIIGLNTDSAGKYNPPEKLTVENTLVLVPLIDTVLKQIDAEMEMDYVYRKVLGGRRTFQEWDDRIKYYTGHVSQKVALLKDKDYVPGFYGIGSITGNKKEFILVRSPKLDTIPLIFNSYDEAVSFREWLLNHPVSEKTQDQVILGKSVLIFKNRSLKHHNLAGGEELGVMPVFW
jgi:hypothetical protein